MQKRRRNLKSDDRGALRIRDDAVVTKVQVGSIPIRARHGAFPFIRSRSACARLRAVWNTASIVTASALTS